MPEDDGMRRSSTYSVASTQYSHPTTSEPTSPVTLGDQALYQRNLRALEIATARLQQVGNHLLPSPYPSPELRPRELRISSRNPRPGPKLGPLEDDDESSQEENSCEKFTKSSRFIRKMRE